MVNRQFLSLGAVLPAVVALLLAGRLPALERLGPIMTPDHFSAAGAAEDGRNINGPSLVRVPDRIPPDRRADPRARYYLYFADHGGRYIRMAWAAAVTGPYHLYQPGRGVLALDAGPSTPDEAQDRRLLTPDLAIGDHIASPHVLVDADGFHMVFHAKAWARRDGAWQGGGQRSLAASSADGLDFTDGCHPGILGAPYLRQFRYRGRLYGIADNGVQVRPPDQSRPYATAWEAVYFQDELKDAVRAMGRDPATWSDDPRNEVKAKIVFRHHAVAVDGDRLRWWFTAKNEAPERIYRADVVLDPDDWRAWRVERLQEVLRPEAAWEGADQPLEPQGGGRAKTRVNGLRDPAFFRDEDGREYLLYCYAGEHGIALARLAGDG